MKRVLSVIAVAAMTTAFVACGPSKEEMEKRKQFQQDSIAAVEKQRQDSLAAEAAKAELAAEEMKQKQLDSLRNDSIAKAEAGGKKKK